VLADSAAQITAADLDLETVRDVMVTAILGEQPLPLARDRAVKPGPAAEKRAGGLDGATRRGVSRRN